MALPYILKSRPPLRPRFILGGINRSRKWDYAETYKDARAISPYPQRPIR